MRYITLYFFIFCNKFLLLSLFKFHKKKLWIVGPILQSKIMRLTMRVESTSMRVESIRMRAESTRIRVGSTRNTAR
jgi:hypothetical protein